MTQGEKQKREWLWNELGDLCLDISNTNCEYVKKQRIAFTKKEKQYSPRYHSGWEIEPQMGRMVNGVSGRVARLKALGNAVVPMHIYPILKAITETYI